MKKVKGQITIILLLVTVIGLTVALSIVGRSTTELSTSTRTEQSTRAFSAAEAGIEQALSETLNFGNTGVATVPVGDSTARVESGGDLPGTGQPLEYPPIGKEEIAQFWLEDFRTGVTAVNFTCGSFNVYFGNCEGAGNCAAFADKPAVEVTTITQTGASYTAFKKFYDSDSGRLGQNRFEAVTCDSATPFSVNTSMSAASKFYCQATVSGYSGTLILTRVRLLYSNGKHKIALGRPTSGCGASDYNLPPQARLITSTGTLGETQRKLQLFTVNKVVPFFFDYAIFAASEITK